MTTPLKPLQGRKPIPIADQLRAELKANNGRSSAAFWRRLGLHGFADVKERNGR